MKKVKVNTIYQVKNKDLKFSFGKNQHHDVVVLSVNKKNNTARVKTITSLERKNKETGEFEFINSKLKDVKNGKILVIPKSELGGNHLSGINHRVINVDLDKIEELNKKDTTKFPKRYKKLIRRR